MGSQIPPFADGKGRGNEKDRGIKGQEMNGSFLCFP